jgi:mannose-1-phosphate guanylyltransferase
MGADGLYGSVVIAHSEGYPTTYGYIATVDELKAIAEYLIASFDGKPIPDLPQAWIDRWTYY